MGYKMGYRAKRNGVPSCQNTLFSLINSYCLPAASKNIFAKPTSGKCFASLLTGILQDLWIHAYLILIIQKILLRLL